MPNAWSGENNGEKISDGKSQFEVKFHAENHVEISEIFQ